MSARRLLAAQLRAKVPANFAKRSQVAVASSGDKFSYQENP
jgi:hypothetical protein